MFDELREEELEQVSGGDLGPGKELRYYCPYCYMRVFESSYLKDDGYHYFRCTTCGKEDIPANDMKRWYADFRVVKDPGYWPNGRI